MVEIATRKTDETGVLRAPPIPGGSKRAALIKRVSWGAIFAGTALTVTVQLVFTMLGAAIGLTAIEPAEGRDPGQGVAIGAGIWWLITGLISLFIGGMIAGRLAGHPERVDAAVHGLLVWSLTGLLGLWVLTTSAARVLGGTFGPLAQGLAYNVSADPANSAEAMNRAASGLAAMGQEAAHQASRAVTPGAEGLPPDQSPPGTDPSGAGAPSSPREDRPAANQARTRAAADQAADVLASASLWSFLALLLGAAVAGMGGMMARPLEGGELVRTAYYAAGDIIEPDRPESALPERRPPE